MLLSKISFVFTKNLFCNTNRKIFKILHKGRFHKCNDLFTICFLNLTWDHFQNFQQKLMSQH